MPRSSGPTVPAGTRLAPRPRPLHSDEVSFAAHAKAILLGEHAVVHGGPAIALPVRALQLTAHAWPTAGPIRVESTLFTGPLDELPELLSAPAAALTSTLRQIGADPTGLTVRVEGEIPAERGLGSSAAVAAAISGAVARMRGVELDSDTQFELVQAAERVAHGNPSGLDARAVTSAAPIWFQSGAVRPLEVDLDGYFVIADSGVTGNTRAAVSDVARLRAAEPARIGGILARIDEHTAAAAEELTTNRPGDLGERMFAVHDLLSELTVSSPELDRLVQAARDAGALGAKLTGGGRGGCVLVLADSAERAATIAGALQAAGATSTWTLEPKDLAP